jgi:hypothetical protein
MRHGALGRKTKKPDITRDIGLWAARTAGRPLVTVEANPDSPRVAICSGPAGRLTSTAGRRATIARQGDARGLAARRGRPRTIPFAVDRARISAESASSSAESRAPDEELLFARERYVNKTRERGRMFSGFLVFFGHRRDGTECMDSPWIFCADRKHAERTFSA